MAAVEITISGVLYDKYNRTQQNVVLIGEASLTGLGIGGGPIYPPEQPPGQPPGIWGPPGPWPTPPIAFPPGWVGGVPPPGWKPPEGITIPPPGSPPQMIGGDHVANPIVSPPFIIVMYPGMGPVIVPQPLPPDQAAPQEHGRRK